jgi:3-phenylpropionate/trans-cinnamate dioxygenase alpha subunit
MCTYHRSAYDIAGKLVGVPGLDELYHNDLDVSANGLREVAQLEVYKGFVLATLDPQAPPLLEFLGRTGITGLEFLAGQGELEVAPSIQKFVIPCNWKSVASRPAAWVRRKVRQPVSVRRGAGRLRALVRMRRMVPAPMWWPSRVSSPWTR